MAFAVHDIAKNYGAGANATAALERVTFRAGEAELLAIVGPSGCGKTTLLKIVAGLIAPSEGRVEFATPRRDGLRTAVVFQDHGLLPWYDVLENVALGLRFQQIPRDQARERARHFIVQVGLERFLHSHPHELSIGMRQRVGIARAFVADPEILLLDEPFGSLDAQTKIVLQQELLRIWQEHRKTVVTVTHDLDEAVLLADRILVMSGRPGRIREEIAVPLPRPRTLDMLATPIAGTIRQTMWNILQEEVRRSLWVPA